MRTTKTLFDGTRLNDKEISHLLELAKIYFEDGAILETEDICKK